MADKYWIGNSGSWSDFNHWSDSSGGPASSVPSSSDNAIFDNNSFSIGGQTVSGASAFIKDIDSSLATNSPTIDIGVAGFLQVSGNLDLSGFGSVIGHNLELKDSAPGGAKTITTGSCNFDNIDLFRISGSSQNGSSWTLLNNLIVGCPLYIERSFDANDFDITASSFNIDVTSANTIYMGNGTWTSNVSSCNFDVLNFNAEGSTIIQNILGPGTTSFGVGQDMTFNDVEINNGNENVTVSFSELSNVTFNNFTVTTGTDTLNLKFHDGYTYTATNMSINGNVDANVVIDSVTLGQTHTLSATTGTFSYLDIQNSIASGPAIPFDATNNCTDNGNNFNWLFALPPVANFTSDVTTGPAPLTVTFTDTSTNAPTSWNWDFGDGNTSTDQNPVNTFSAVGNYNVTLEATNAYGSDTITKTNYVIATSSVIPYTSIQNTFFAVSDTDGDVQLLNVGTNDDSTPIYYELETQDIELGKRFHNKQISNRMAVFTRDADGSKFMCNADDKGYFNIDVNLKDRVNISTSINSQGRKFNFKWLGNSSNTSPVFEGFKVENITDFGIIK